MARFMEDTSPEMERVWLEMLRRRTPAERFRRVCELNAMLERGAIEETRLRFPNATERELRLRVASRRISPELMRAAFGWNPDEEGY